MKTQFDNEAITQKIDAFKAALEEFTKGTDNSSEIKFNVEELQVELDKLYEDASQINEYGFCDGCGNEGIGMYQGKDYAKACEECQHKSHGEYSEDLRAKDGR